MTASGGSRDNTGLPGVASFFKVWRTILFQIPVEVPACRAIKLSMNVSRSPRLLSAPMHGRPSASCRRGAAT